MSLFMTGIDLLFKGLKWLSQLRFWLNFNPSILIDYDGIDCLIFN